MKTRKAAHRSAKKTKPAARQTKPRKRLVRPASKKQKAAAPASEPEVRRAIPLDYVTTDEVNLRAARKQYEPRVAGRQENFWKGLVNRWDNSLDFAHNVA